MESKRWVFPVAALLFLLTPSPTDACSCYLIHLQKDFCHSSVVIKGKFLNCVEPPPIDYDSGDVINEGDMLTRCDVEILEVFKGRKEIQNMKFTIHSRICTLPTPALNTEYLITGDIARNSVVLTMCNYIKKWTEVSSEQILGIRGAYSGGCSCKIARINHYFDKNYCVLDGWNDLQPEDSVQDQKQTCAPIEPDTCAWKDIE